MSYFLIIAAALLRLVPHIPNFAPITAIGLFSGTYLNKRWALVIPVVALLFSDFFIGFYNWQVMVAVYGSFVISSLLGIWLKKRKSAGNTALVTLAASLQFYLITNFAVWAFGGLYPATAEGLVASYVNALPFLRNTLLGDFFYVGIMFGAYELVRYYLSKRELSTAHNKIGQ